MPDTFNVRKAAFAIEMETFQGEKGKYLVLKSGNEFHVFAEVEAKEAATDCGCKLPHNENNPTTMWTQLWKQKQGISTAA